MYKVILIEDESAVRERIKRNVDWEGHGFELIGEAGDGEMAYTMILENNPDVMITDIKMPFMDGLELSRLVRVSRPKVKIMILSGYDEFEYAKEAISIGVTDYLLKPITPRQLVEALEKVATILDKEKEQERDTSFHLDNEEKNKSYAKRRFFDELVTCKQGMGDLLERAKELEVELIAPSYSMVLLKVLLQEVTIEDYEAIHQQVSKGLEEWCQQHTYCICFDREAEGWALLIRHTREGVREEDAISALRDFMRDFQSVSYCMGVGAKVSRMSEISHAFDTANKALAYRYLLSHQEVIYYEQLGRYSTLEENKQISITNLDVTKFEEGVVTRFLKTGIQSEVEGFAISYIQNRGQGADSFLFRQYMMMDIYFNIVGFVEQIGYDKNVILERLGDIQELTIALQTKEETFDYLKEQLEKALVLRDEVSGRRYSHLLEEAKAYIAKYYNKESISLNTVAEYVNISPSHFSAIFSQEMSQTFISYLTQVRMKKAKELLRCSAMKTLEVGFAVGYKDPHYFSYLFKKTQGCTPKEYRKLNKET